MANNSPTDYKKLFLQAEERRKQEEERRKQAEEREKQAEERRKQEEEGRKQEEEGRKQAEEREKQAEERRKQEEEGRKQAEEREKQAEERRKQEEEGRKQAEEREKQAEERRKQEEEGRKQEEERRKQEEEGRKQAEERNRQTTFAELLHLCHSLLSRPLRFETPSRSTTGTIPLPIGKYCPTRLALWTDCSSRQQKIYSSVCNYLQPTEEAPARLFTPLIALEDCARRFGLRPISSEQGLENYERIAVEDHVRDIIAELCKIDAARDEFGLGDGIWFDNHTKFINPKGGSEANANQPSRIRNPRPDQFCINRVNGNTNTLLTTGNGSMEMHERLVCSAIVQEYHVMIQEGLEYSYVTNGVARILLRVPYDDPSTVYYFFCDPNSEQSLQEPKTSIARVLCLCLMAFHSPVRGQEWRNTVQSRLHLWTTSFDHALSQTPKEVLQQISPQSDSTDPEYVSPESSSDYQPSSPLQESPTAGRRVRTRSQASCAPSDVRHRTQSPDSSGSDSNQATGRKRGFSQIRSSPSAQRAARQIEAAKDKGGHSKRHDAQFCTQRCLLGLQTGGILDDSCPNMKLHRRGQDVMKHSITAEDLVGLLKAQLDENIDRCTPLGNCGAYGAPFKLICDKYGYVVVGKGTTSGLWKEVSREAQVYQVLRKAQASAVPVFLGTIDLKKIYFLHGAGEIRHMLVMGWGGESTATMELTPGLLKNINKSNKEIEALGIFHEDLRPDNILWNEELRRALIIDFHRSTLKCRPAPKRSRAKTRFWRTESGDVKR
ncbi:Protein kinase-like domain [Penicillium digitatum]|uniref:Protein kinase-like domain n=1 Tax=Penicillium digitatum TaxID=36651 RepID=A0A7T6XTC1_PENDI|nr:Protein kinase-like domain [Penicillium digitatum]